MEAASLFVDISGFTAVTNALVQLGPEAIEEMAAIMSSLWNPLIDGFN